MPSSGTQTISSTGRNAKLSADGTPMRVIGGVTIDWSTVAAAGAATTLPDNTPIAVNDQYLRYGRVLCRITATGFWGPYDAAANDGRQTLTRGNCVLVNRTMFKSDVNSDHPDVIEGGLVYEARITDLAANPSRADLLTAFPSLRLHKS